MISYLFSKFFETQKQEEQIKLVEERVVFEREGARPFYGFKNVENLNFNMNKFIGYKPIYAPFFQPRKTNFAYYLDNDYVEDTSSSLDSAGQEMSTEGTEFPDDDNYGDDYY